MSHTISKAELKRPDQLRAWGLSLLNILVQNSKVVYGVVGLVVVGGLAGVISSKVSQSQEMARQEEYYSIEKTYLKKKEAFEKGAAEAKKAEAKKDAPKEITEDGVKAQVASGDLIKDYGPEVEAWKKLISESPRAQAAAMAALELSQVYLKYDNKAEATQILGTVKEEQKPNHLLGAMVYHAYANLLADQNRCTEAITVWDALLAAKKEDFMAESAQYGQALCYESMGQVEKAEGLLKAITAEKPSTDKSAGPKMKTQVQRMAEKYLKYLNTKKQIEGTKSAV